MGWLTKRSTEKEILDVPGQYTQAEFEDCQRKLYWMNRYLLGCIHKTVQVIRRLPDMKSIMDFGCGGGLMTLALGQYFPKSQVVGTDISADAIRTAELAKRDYPEKLDHVSFQLITVNQALPEVDVLVANLVCHHLSDADMVVFLQRAVKAARQRVIINDLHRHWLAYGLFKWISPVFFRNNIITHDGLISIKRGFTRAEWVHLLTLADIKHYQIRWRLFFIFQVTIVV